MQIHAAPEADGRLRVARGTPVRAEHPLPLWGAGRGRLLRAAITPHDERWRATARDIGRNRANTSVAATDHAVLGHLQGRPLPTTSETGSPTARSRLVCRGRTPPRAPTTSAASGARLLASARVPSTTRGPVAAQFIGHALGARVGAARQRTRATCDRPAGTPPTRPIRRVRDGAGDVDLGGRLANDRREQRRRAGREAASRRRLRRTTSPCRRPRGVASTMTQHHLDRSAHFGVRRRVDYGWPRTCARCCRRTPRVVLTRRKAPAQLTVGHVGG